MMSKHSIRLTPFQIRAAFIACSNYTGPRGRWRQRAQSRVVDRLSDAMIRINAKIRSGYTEERIAQKKVPVWLSEFQMKAAVEALNGYAPKKGRWAKATQWRVADIIQAKLNRARELI